MRNIKLQVGTLIATLLLTPASQASAGEKLSDILRDSNWEGIIGTWVDAESKGAAFKAKYAWKIKDRVIEITTKDANRESVALMGVNGKTGEVFHMGVDGEGTSSFYNDPRKTEEIDRCEPSDAGR